MPRRASALKFDLSPDGMRCLVVWPYEPPRNARPAGGRRWLDVQAGHQIVVHGRFETVYRVRLYRSSPIVEGEPESSRAGPGKPARRIVDPPVEPPGHAR